MFHKCKNIAPTASPLRVSVAGMFRVLFYTRRHAHCFKIRCREERCPGLGRCGGVWSCLSLSTSKTNETAQKADPFVLSQSHRRLLLLARKRVFVLAIEYVGEHRAKQPEQRSRGCRAPENSGATPPSDNANRPHALSGDPASSNEARERAHRR